MRLSKIKIQEIMEQKGISTFKELAEKLGITPNQLSVNYPDPKGIGAC